MNKDNCIYSLRIEYIDKDTPAFVIHYIGRRKRPKKKIHYKIHIGWIIVGYPERFIFERRNHDIKITKKKCEEMTKEKIGDHLSYKCNIDQFFNHSSKLGICVIESPLESSNYDMHESKMVTGIHFPLENSTCMFFHSLDNCHNVDNNINEISPSKIICKYVTSSLK
ncbi:hypothetical protein F8M41_017882 [Gigaspora margarita]|uniref:DUF7431 domain-containing protein n=1 Tax=Gigaspora margarita TaxID=4874 RepID=A0A8H4ELU9_GIGMA|nr:hypothetical protein F8M41_017882 [Gigaspora margarita]